MKKAPILVTAALLAAALALPSPAEDSESKDKPNRVERAAKKTAKGVERTAKRAGKAIERGGKAIERGAEKTETWVKKKLE